VIRDGRNVTLSNMAVRFGPTSAVEGALVWRRVIRQARAAGTKLGPSRYCEVRYEDLLDNPERELGRLCEFGSLAYDDGMLNYYQKTDEMNVNWKHHRNLSLPPTKGLRDWRDEMLPSHLAMFEILAGPVLTESGYERAGGKLDSRGRAELAACWATFQGRRVRQRLPQGLKRRIKARESEHLPGGIS
jgi:hypothetical protein